MIDGSASSSAAGSAFGAITVIGVAEGMSGGDLSKTVCSIAEAGRWGFMRSALCCASAFGRVFRAEGWLNGWGIGEDARCFSLGGVSQAGCVDGLVV